MSALRVNNNIEMQPTKTPPKLSSTTQTIIFSEGDDVTSSEVTSSDVVVSSTAGSHNHGSSKVKLKSLVDYNWEPKFYPGQLLAVHLSGKYLAYSIKAPNAANPGTWNGMVRVVHNPEPDIDRRTLIKGMKGEVQDLAFAHIQNQVLLACIDELGNFYIHQIEITDSGLRTSLVLEVREDTGVGGSTHRVVWCPYIPDEDDDASDEDAAKLLLTTHANIARMWNIGQLCREQGAGGEALGAGALLAGGGGGGARAAAEHAAPLLAAAFSPDGSALATAAADGYVMFFQVYMNNENSPRCLHKWQPHGGKPLSSLFFLDNHKNYNTDVQFWKFAVTGAENNTSIKVWSCKSWNCLQTISFTPSIGPDASLLGMKAMLDTSASYLLLSDFRARSLYVLHMARDDDDSTAYCKSISEFLLPYPVLSFCIVDAEEIQPKCDSGCDDPYHRNGDEDNEAESPDEFDLHHDVGATECSGSREAHTRLRLYIVQPKGLQEGELLYDPPAPFADLLPGMERVSLESRAEGGAPLASSILQQQSQQLKNLLMRSQTQPGSLISQRPESPTIPQQLNLMTPDAFSSPGKRDEDDPPLSATPDVGIKQRASISGEEARAVTASVSGVNAVGGASVVGGAGGAGGAGAEAKAESARASGGSSPSREVQQIMAHDADDNAYYNHMEEEEASSETGEAVAAERSEAQSGAEALFAAADLYASPDKPPPPNKLTHSSSETSWPLISMAQITEANQRKASSEKSCSQSASAPLTTPLNAPLPLAAPLVPTNAPMGAPLTPLNAPLAPLAAPLVPLNPTDVSQLLAEARAVPEEAMRKKLEALEDKLDKLTELLSQQSRELRSLRGEVRAPREALDEALEAHAARTAAAIHTALSDGWERIARVGEVASVTAAAAAGKGAARALEPLAAALQHELAAKLSATDQLLRDNIDKLVHSKSVMNSLSAAIAKSLSEQVREGFRATLADSVLPVMEKAHAQIFKQINHAFQTGTKEFAANTEAAARAAAERGGAAAASGLRAALERHAEALAQHTQLQQQQPAQLQPHQFAAALKEVTHSVLEKEMTWWREQVRSVASQVSRAHSPATPAAHSVADRQIQVSQIQSLVMSGDVNGAFQLALSASDLALVVAACRAAEPARVFGPPCRLKQHVLLSLVQQLAADMPRDTHLKHRYLEEAIMNLDTSNPVTREHLPGVVRELQKQIVAFLAAHPAHALTRQFRMLLMATEALVKGSV